MRVSVPLPELPQAVDFEVAQQRGHDGPQLAVGARMIVRLLSRLVPEERCRATLMPPLLHVARVRRQGIVWIDVPLASLLHNFRMGGRLSF